MHMVFVKYEKRVEFRGEKHRGSQPIESTAEETIEFLKDVFNPESWEIIEA